MNKAILFFFAASAISSVALAGLAGLAINTAASAASREVRFDILTINPVTGQASSTQKQVFTLFTGALDVNNFVVGPNGWALSLQAFDRSQMATIDGTHTTNAITPRSEWAYLARQDLNEGGRFEFCQLSLANKPINIFFDSDNSVFATTVTTSGSFALTRIRFQQHSANCEISTLANLPSVAGVVANVKAQLGNRIYLLTEPSVGFSASSGVQIRAFEISNNQATVVSTTQLLASIVPTAINPLGGDMINVQGWLAPSTSGATPGTAGTFVSYDINLQTYAIATTLTSRSITASNEQITFSAVFNNQTNSIYSLKNVEPTASTATTFLTTPQVTTLSLASATAAETKGSTTTLNTLNIVNLFLLNTPTASAIRIDAVSATSSAVVLSGSQFLFAGLATIGTGNINAVSVSRCRFTFTNAGTTTPTTFDTVATGSGDSASCTLTTLPLAGTIVTVDFARDGVNFARATTFNFGGSIVASRFVRPSYNLRDDTIIEAAAEKVAVEYLDSANNKVLFAASTAATVTLTVAATGNAAIRSATGLTASRSNGLATFPELSVDVTAADATGIAQITLSSAVGTNTATTSLKVELTRATRGTLGAIAFPTQAVTTTAQVFDLHLVNPAFSTTNAAYKIGNTRALSDTTAFNTATNVGPGLALGLTTYDRDTKVLNTVEVTAAGTIVLNGVSIFTSTTTSNSGTGACILGTTATANNNDGPISIWYEKTDTTFAIHQTSFLAITRNTDSATTGANGSGLRLVRYTRAAGSAATATCTPTLVDLLPIFDAGYGNFHTVPLSQGRIAFIEKDAFFTATANAPFGTQANSLLSVFRYSTTNPTVAGMWTIRNKQLTGFSVASVTQTAMNELAISGINFAGTVAGVWLVDISSDTTAVVAPTANSLSLYSPSNPINDQAIFLAGGSESTASFTRLRYQGSVAAQSTFASVNTALRANVETVQLLRGTTVAAASRNNEVTGRNYIAFFQLEDPVITALIPNSVPTLATATNILVTANHVLASNQLLCRFSSLASIPVQTSIAQLRTSATATSTSLTTATATATLQADGQIVDCGPLPSIHSANNAYVFVQLSNDNGNNWGPEGQLAVGNVAPIVSAIPVAAASAAAVTTGTVFFEVFGDFLNTPATNQAALSALLTTTVPAILGSSWSISSPFTVGASPSTTATATTTTTTATTRSTFTITYATTATAGRLAALQATTQTAAQRLAALQAAIAANSAAFTAVGANPIVRQVSGVSNLADTNDNDLSQGAIAGIVIACIVGFFIIVALIAFLILKSKKGKDAKTFSQSRNYDARAGSSSSADYSSDDYSDDNSSDDYSDYV